MHSKYERSLILPDELRSKLREPLGRLLANSECIELLKEVREDLLVSVGDVVTDTLVKEGIYPDVCIIDNRSERRAFHISLNYERRIIYVKNPPGHITKELFNAIELAYDMVKSHLKVEIEVEGEEDLAALPAIAMAPDSTTVVYGMPQISTDKSGVVMVEGDLGIKEKVNKILSELRSWNADGIGDNIN